MSHIDFLKKKDILLSLYFSGERSPKVIAKKTGLNKSTINFQLKKLKNNGNLKHRGGNGRQYAITSKMSNSIAQQIRYNSERTTTEIARNLHKTFQTAVGNSTIKKWLKKHQYKNVLPRRIPMLSEIHRQKRVEWC